MIDTRVTVTCPYCALKQNKVIEVRESTERSELEIVFCVQSGVEDESQLAPRYRGCGERFGIEVAIVPKTTVYKLEVV